MEFNDFENALKIEQDLIYRFIVGLYKHYNNVENVNQQDLTKFIDIMENDPAIPFSKEEIQNYLSRYETIDFEQHDLGETAQNIYGYISKFFDIIQAHLKKEEENNE